MLSKASLPYTRLAFGGIAAPSVGNALQLASLHCAFSDAETYTNRFMLTCMSRQSGDRNPDSPGHADGN